MKKLIMVMLFLSSISTAVFAVDSAEAPVDAAESPEAKDCGDINNGARDGNPAASTNNSSDTSAQPASDTLGQ